MHLFSVIIMLITFDLALSNQKTQLYKALNCLIILIIVIVRFVICVQWILVFYENNHKSFSIKIRQVIHLKIERYRTWDGRAFFFSASYRTVFTRELFFFCFVIWLGKIFIYVQFFANQNQKPSPFCHLISHKIFVFLKSYFFSRKTKNRILLAYKIKILLKFVYDTIIILVFFLFRGEIQDYELSYFALTHIWKCTIACAVRTWNYVIRINC
jgi:hypothetical protein